MKLYTFCTDSHRHLLDGFFLPSLHDPFDVVVVAGQQNGEGTFRGTGWNRLMLQKVDTILRAIEENPGQPFVYSDVDVQFFRPIGPALRAALQSCDLAVQADDADGQLCAGFFAGVGTSALHALWSELRHRLLADPHSRGDQLHLNAILRDEPWQRERWLARAARVACRRVFGVRRATPMLRNEFRVRWRYLPPAFESVGVRTGRVWERGQAVGLATDALMHHANWTIGTDNKAALMAEVRRLHLQALTSR